MKKLNLIWIIALIFIIRSGFVYADDQMGCWTFDQATDGYWNDSGSLGYEYDFEGINGYTAGVLGEAATFDGANQILSVNFTRSDEIRGVMFWMKDITIITNENAFEFQSEPTDKIIVGEQGANDWTIPGQKVDDSWICLASTQRNLINRWVHIAFVINTSGSGDLRAYLNGSLIYTCTAGIPMEDDNILSLAYSTQHNAHSVVNIDNLVIYNRTLTPDEITANFNSGSGVTCLSEPPPEVAPVLSEWNVTANVAAGENSSSWNDNESNEINITSNGTSITLVTDINSNCTGVVDLDQNYSVAFANDTNYKFATTTTTSHSYTVLDNFSVGGHCLYVHCVNSDNINLDTTSGCLNFTRKDIISPTWTEYPANTTREFNRENVSIDFNATDDVEIDTYFINDTNNFTISATGVLSNTSFLGILNFYINVSVNDTSGNTNSTIFNVNITDTISPAFTQYPDNITIGFEQEGVNMDFNATDDSGIDTWYINETTNFTINKSTGVLTNITFLGVTLFNILVSVNDTSNNINQTVFEVNITIIDITAPTITILHPVNGTAYGATSLDLNWTVTEEDNLDWCAYSLDGEANITFNSTTLCYQETANVSTSCGGLDTGSYANISEGGSGWWTSVNNAYDGNWSSRTYASGGPDYSNGTIYMNYTIPTQSIGAIWAIRHSTPGTYLNISIPSNCFSTSLQLKFFSEEQPAGTGQGWWYCKNSTNWVELFDAGGGDGGSIYEEGIYWNITNTSQLINTTLTSLSEGSHNVTIWCNDTAGNMGQSNYTYFSVDTTPPTFDEYPANRTIEFNVDSVGIDINATDTSGIDTWWTNETDNFTINSSGYLSNTTFLGIFNFYINISVNDTFGNTNSMILNINISDTIPPIITVVYPVNSTTYNVSSSLDLNWTSNEEVDWCVFELDSNGTNITLGSPPTNTTLLNLTEGSYNVTIFCNDTAGNMGQSNYTYFTIVFIDLNHTASFGPYGSFHFQPIYSNKTTYVEPDGQSATNFSFNITNTDLKTGQVEMSVNTTHINYTLFCNTAYSNLTGFIIQNDSTENVTINSSLAADNTENIWCWMNYTAPNTTLNFKVYLNLRG